MLVYMICYLWNIISLFQDSVARGFPLCFSQFWHQQHGCWGWHDGKYTLFGCVNMSSSMWNICCKSRFPLHHESNHMDYVWCVCTLCFCHVLLHICILYWFSDCVCMLFFLSMLIISDNQYSFIVLKLHCFCSVPVLWFCVSLVFCCVF